ncbi:transcriptional adapter 1 [Agrilus planipennis]|uniref:Transcriptional adapter 1 n=1 Tax=Agrilus planipennis TaxID=224129 RepID=A0A1W4XFC8_AGRPL|nr:transcriptional adapter 1 [Agrilus planipennis]
MSTLYETKRNLELSMTEELKKQYFSLLKKWFLFSGSITKTQFDSVVRSLLTTKEQIRNHNALMIALFKKVNNSSFKEIQENSSDGGSFEMAENVPPSSPATMPPADFENRSAASELFLPDSSFIAMRININAWENELHGVEEGVAEMMIQACQIFVKNIITAMISRKKGYKIRDGKLQYGFEMPVPDPLVRNTNNIIDSTQESKVEVSNEEDCFIPSRVASLENVEQQTAFAYSCGHNNNSDNTLTVQLLYDTLRDNPNILGLHSIHSINLLKLGLQIEEAV